MLLEWIKSDDDDDSWRINEKESRKVKLKFTAYLKSLLLIHPRHEEEACTMENRDLQSSLKKKIKIL